MNLDPLENYADSELWQVLECAHLMPFVRENPKKMDYECGEGGHNLRSVIELLNWHYEDKTWKSLL